MNMVNERVAKLADMRKKLADIRSFFRIPDSGAQVKIIHVSDTHGKLPHIANCLDGVELIVHSGDLMPNITWGDRPVEEAYQAHWCMEKEAEFDHWREGRTVIFCAGNHDFIIPKWKGLIDCTNKVVSYRGTRFYGFPYVPKLGNWNYGCNPAELRARFDPVAQIVEHDEVDMLVCHCPPWGVLDSVPKGHWFGEDAVDHIGNPALTFYLRHWKWKPDAILCGHVHESHGVARREGVFVSNAATTFRVLEV